MSKEKKPKKRKPGALTRREARMGYLFVLPWMIGTLLLVIYPLIRSFWFSLNKIKLTPTGMKMTWINVKNYTDIFLEDPDFITNLQSYLTETILSIPVIVVFALIIAMLLNEKIHLRGFFRLIFFLPVIIASGPVMNQLVSQDAASIPAMNVTMITQLLDEYLPGMIAEAVASVFSNMIMILWYSGVQILIFLAAIQKIDTSLYEAAKIDGGSGWECFWKITLPTIKPMILLNAVYTVILLSNNEQNSIITLIYDTMFSVNGGYGYASAMAWMYAVIVTLIIGVVALLLMGRKDVYERRAKKYQKELRKQERLQRQIRRRGMKNERRREKNAA